MQSIWTKTAKHPEFPALDKDIRTDVLIIGGGIAGILCAYMLQQKGVRYVLAEAGRICSGVTENTTAKLTFQHGLCYDKLIRTFGHERAGMYLQANLQALEQYRALAERIECGYEELPSAVYALQDREVIEREVMALQALGCSARCMDALPLPFSVAGAVQVEKQAQFHPLQFLYALTKDLCIYENTKVLELSPGQARTEHGTIFADKIIIATHFPILNKHGGYFLKLYQHRSYVLALKNARQVHGMYVDASDKGLSFRNAGELLLLGGGSHRTGKKGGNWQELSAFVRRYDPTAREVCRWATQDCMTLDGVPYIGRYSKHTPELYVAAGFNKWGMSSSMAAAIILADMVMGKKSDYSEVFSPQRNMIRPQLFINTVESLAGLLNFRVPRCPHMGCALTYNPQEHSWDCSCHGSRFAEDGKLLNNPATDDKKV